MANLSVFKNAKQQGFTLVELALSVVFFSLVITIVGVTYQYFVDAIEVDGEEVSDNSWVLAYNEGVIVGARMWNGAYTDIPAMGNDGSLSTSGYMEVGTVPRTQLHIPVPFVVYYTPHPIKMPKVDWFIYPITTK